MALKEALAVAEPPEPVKEHIDEELTYFHVSGTFAVDQHHHAHLLPCTWHCKNGPTSPCPRLQGWWQALIDSPLTLSKNIKAQEPQQLLNIFARMEGQNLMLIQSSQEAERALEGGLAKQRSVRARLDSEAASLQDQVRELQAACDQQAAICADLKVCFL